MKKSGTFNGRFCSVFLFGAVLALTAVRPVQGQELQPQVRLMLERLPLEKQEKLKNFADMIEAYIKDHDWTGEMTDDVLPVTLQIFLEDQSVSYESRYSGTFMISNNSDLQYYDKYWKFAYEAGDPLYHDEHAYDPFRGFIDFYVYLILGGEYDKYGKFLGNPYYEKAKMLSEQAKFSIQYIIGWRERGELIDFILSEQNKPFRVMKDRFFLGLSYVGEEDTTARRYVREALVMLDDVLREMPEHKEAQQFIGAHHQEFLEMLKDDDEVIDRLIRMDPEHRDLYQQHR